MITRNEAQEIADRCLRQPSFFFEKFLGVKPWPYQLSIVESVRDYRVTSVRSCHEIGKSFSAARVTLWYLLTHPESIVVTTAPTARQVEDILWREINTAYNKALLPLGGRCLTTRLEFDTNWYAVGLSTNQPDKFQGYHSDSGDMLVIVDEAAGVEENIFEGIRALMTSDNCRLLLIGNPTSSSGTFYNYNRPDSLAHRLKVSAFDTPNFTANGIKSEQDLLDLYVVDDYGQMQSTQDVEMPAPYLVSPKWVYEFLVEVGADTPMYQARVLGEHPDQGDDTLIPLKWIEAAMTDERRDQTPKGAPVYGVDPARFGNDRTAIQERRGDHVLTPEAFTMQDTMRTAGRVMDKLTNDPLAHANIDVIGLGAGVVDRLNELQREKRETGEWQWTRIHAINVAESPFKSVREKEQEKKGLKRPRPEFINKRAQTYWTLREKFERGEIYIPKNSMGLKLAGELSAIKYEWLSSGKIRIEEKEEYKKRLLSSPDLADALMLSYADSEVGDFVLTTTKDDDEDAIGTVAGNIQDKVF